MSTNLVPAGSVAAVNVGPLVDPVRVIAANPTEMQLAQAGLASWFRQKLELARRDQRDADDNLTTARVSGFKCDSFKRAAARAKKFVEYYEKCLAAVEAGYMIIPDLPVDIFAIRTTNNFPKSATSRSAWENSLSEFPQKSNAPAMDDLDASYVDVFPTRSIWKEEYREKPDGELKERFVARPESFTDVEFPIALATPQVLSATQAAMAADIFDEIGGLPRRREKGDPIVVGRIIRPGSGDRSVGPGGKQGVTFLIAWWVDTRQL